MASFSPAFLDELRARLSLVSVVGRRVRLTRKGREHGGLCPFHNEKSPSFTVNEDKGFFHCFGCGAHGDVIGFEMRAGGLSFPEAVEKLAAEAGLEIPKATPQEVEQAQRAASLQDATEAACHFYQACLFKPMGSAARDYLRRRGLSEQTIATFRLGYAPDNRTALAQALREAEIPEDLAIEAGVLGRSERGVYDRFHGRVMFPILDRRGKVIAFGGRTLGEEKPKYLNSPDSPLFHKGTVLYGLSQARTAAGKSGQILVCEGYMDVIALHQAGFPQAVAPLGTAITEQQIELLWKIVAEPILCLDGDSAGQRAAGRAADRALPLLKPGYSLRFALLPPAEDPDSLVRQQGAGAMRAVLDKALPLSEVVWRTTLARHPHDTPEQRAAFEQDLYAQIDKIGDETVRGHYRQVIKDRLWQHFHPRRTAAPRGVTPGAGRGGRSMSFRPNGALPGVASMMLRGADGRLSGAGAPTMPTPPGERQEALMLRAVLNHPELLENCGERLGRMDFCNPELDKLRQEILMQHPGWHGLDSVGRDDYLRQRGFARHLDRLTEVIGQIPASFVRPDASIEQARKGWDHLYKLYSRKELDVDLSQAERDAAEDLTPERMERLTALALSKLQG